MAVVVGLPDLTMGNFRKLEPSQLERNARPNMDRLWLKRLTIDDVFVVDVCGQGGLDCFCQLMCGCIPVTYSDQLEYCMSATVPMHVPSLLTSSCNCSSEP
jgi:hypothetical protein